MKNVLRLIPTFISVLLMMKAFSCTDQPSTHIRPREKNSMIILRQLICVFYETQQSCVSHSFI